MGALYENLGVGCGKTFYLVFTWTENDFIIWGDPVTLIAGHVATVCLEQITFDKSA